MVIAFIEMSEKKHFPDLRCKGMKVANRKHNK